ncbi:MAG: hypothetical protein CFE46_07885 [Burkholderiales bacterium PBB6]|nr:MAG: hypothetical protein CFE46_07885 [Burkholderiales bacterium PBB6]
MVAVFRSWRFAVTSLALTGLVSVVSPAFAQTPDPTWQAVPPASQKVLAPLAKDWPQLTPDSRRKWLEIAQRYPNLPADQQQRMQERMSAWARMTPAERGQARVNFQQTQQRPATDRQAQWEAYRSLPPAEKAELAARAQPETPAKPPATGARALRNAPLDAQAPKQNIVGAGAAPAAGPKPVAPTLVQGNPGATTSLVTAKPMPPAHQPAGMPKISAGSGMVDKATLLPKGGPQAAGTPNLKPASAKPSPVPTLPALPVAPTVPVAAAATSASSVAP